MKKVSVIIAVYNGERFIGSTVESILSQSYPNIELIVVDDGSRDNTIDILKQYERDIKILFHEGKINKGQAAALNLGLKHSAGDYISFCDADDILLRDKIKMQVEVLEANKTVSLVYCNGYAIDENGNILYELFPSDFVETNEKARLLLDCYIRTPAMIMVRRGVFDVVGCFDEKLYFSKDHDMWLRINEKYDLFYMKEKLILYRQHANALSKIRDWRINFYVLNKAMQRHDYGYVIYMKRLAVIYYRLGEANIRNSKYILAFFYYIMAFFCDPVRAIRVVLFKSKDI